MASTCSTRYGVSSICRDLVRSQLRSSLGMCRRCPASRSQSTAFVGAQRFSKPAFTQKKRIFEYPAPVMAALRPATAGFSTEDSPSWSSRLASLAGAAVLCAAVLLSSPCQARAEGFSFKGLMGQQQATQSTLEMKVPDYSELASDERETVHLFQVATPSVVNIANIADVAVRRSYMTMDVQKIPLGTGSGFVWDREGHVVTNFHVVRGASEVQVALIDQSVYKAKLVGADPDKDIAVLQLLEVPPAQLRELKPVSLGSSTSLLVGQRVYAIGNPFGLDHTLTQGIISGLGRELATGYRGLPIRNVIQTDAAINPGNSGGVLLDSKGRLIGVNTAIADPTGKGSSSGVGFAIPIDTVKGLVEQILRYGKVIRPVLGITVAPPQTLRQIGVEGVLVLDVPPGSPAYKAGMLGTVRDNRGRVVLGDIITSIDGKPIKTQKDLLETLDECKVGQAVKVGIFRDEKQVEIKVVLAERSDPDASFDE